MTVAANTSPPALHPNLANAFRDFRRVVWSVVIFSGAVNLLMLAGPLYMLQVYDRVLASRSIPTLIGLSTIMIGAYALQGLLDFVRSRILVRAAALMDQHLDTDVHNSVVKLAGQGNPSGDAQNPLRDLDQIRSFLISAGPLAVIDLPWMPIFLALCFLVHPVLGLVALTGAVALVVTTIVTERKSRQPVRTLGQCVGLRSSLIEADSRNNATATAMGMVGTLAQRWNQANERYLAALNQSSDVAGGYGSISKVLRMVLQSAILGTGAYLVIQQELSAGSMIAASIMMGRALAPVESLIANWRGLIAARQSVKNLSDTLTRTQPETEKLQLLKPKMHFDVRDLWVAAPGSQSPIVREVRFRLTAGEVLGVIGPSGAGKTSLIRTLVGVWPPGRGCVRIDDAALDQWHPEALGKSVGFVAHPVELFDGTIAENIARMADNYDGHAVIKAAQAAGAHEMVLRLPHGYNTQIGQGGATLSAGQRQRIALARALYNDPFLIVLDEPHANLDHDGEHSLTDAILACKERGAIVIFIAHRPTELVTCDKILVLANGAQQTFGDAAQILNRLNPNSTAISPRQQFDAKRRATRERG